MTNFTDLTVILDLLVENFTGTRAILSLFIMFFFFVSMTIIGMRPEIVLVLLLPLAGFFVAIGYFGEVAKSEWIVNLILIILGFFYGWAMVRLMT